MKQDLVAKEQQELLVDGLAYADRFINRQYLSNIDVHAVKKPEDDYRQIRLFHITKLVFDMEENTNDKLISVYGALNSIQSAVLLLVHAARERADIYIGTRCEQSSTAGSILGEALRGNFGGSELQSLTNTEIKATLSEALLSGPGRNNVSSVTLVPSLRDNEKDRFVQGLEKLIDSMSGRDYTAIFIAEPLSHQVIEEKKRGFEELYATISPFSETSLAYGNNASHAVANGTFRSFADSINHSVTNSTSESESQTHTSGTNASFNSSSRDGDSSSGASVGFSSSDSYGSSTTFSNAVTSGSTKTNTTGENETITDTIGESRTLTIKHINKSVTELMEHIDRQLDRIRECESFGLWSAAAYFISTDIQTTVIGASTLRALLAGDDTQIDRAFINTWNGTNSPYVGEILKSISNGRHPVIRLPRANQYDAQNVKPAVLVSGKELPLFLSLPHHSVPGLVVDHMASFGRAVFNPTEEPQAEKFPLGNVLHKGIVQPVKVELNLEEFRSHCFITGSTGSGKSNTSYHLLESFIRRHIPFLVIEPAKGEYKFAFGGLPGVNIFWTNPAMYRLLRLNPFSFPAEVHVLEHMDRLIEIFNACWPLYSAMPAILKASVERAYISCGWDLVQSRRFGSGTKVFPTFEDLLRELPRVIGESSYSADTKGDYIGALVTRVSSLTNGIMGSIFCSPSEIPDTVLFDENTIVDLSRVGASETKALIMGILVMKLNEHRMSKSEGMNLNLRHITVLEEAHNLLRRTGMGQSAESSNVAGKSVEMISNSIAEMRTYGEGFIIIDQSPTAVDISAIKNTNTKIVMRLPERADFETIGNAFALDEEQIREIARLRRGAAIVSQSGWLEPVMVSVCRAGNTYEVPVQRMTVPERDDGTIEKVLNVVLGQFINAFFNERPVRRLLEESSLSVNQKDDILTEYRRIAKKAEREGEVAWSDRITFIVRTAGCRALADIRPINITKVDANNVMHYLKWKKDIMEMLDQYVLISDEDLKQTIAKSLFNYMARVVKKPSYVRAYQILNKKE